MFPLKYCKHRWLENVPVVRRATEMWPSVCVYVQKVEGDKRYTEPTCKSYTIIKGATTDVMVPAKMATFETFASQLQPFLTTFQSDNPLLPFVCSELQKIITALMKRFVQPSILAEVQTATQLMKVKHQDSATCVKPGKVDVGYIAERELKQLLKWKAVRGRCTAAVRHVHRESCSRQCMCVSSVQLQVRSLGCILGPASEPPR